MANHEPPGPLLYGVQAYWKLIAMAPVSIGYLLAFRRHSHRSKSQREMLEESMARMGGNVG